MRSSNNRTTRITVIGIFIAFLVVALLMFWFAYSADVALLNATLREAEKNGEQLEIKMEGNIKESVNDLEQLAEYTADSDVTSENAVDFLNSQSQSEGFDALYYVQLDGKGFSVKNYVRNFSDSELFSCALEKEYFVSDPHVSSETDMIVFDISVPVIKNDEVTAVLICEISIADFLNSYKEDVGDAGDIFIIDQDMNFIYSTSEQHQGIEAIPESDIEEMGQENIITARRDILNSQSGGFYYDYYGIEKVMAYMPINLTNWALAINAEIDSINSELNAAIDQVKDISKVVFFALIVVIVYTWISQTRSLKLLEKTAYYDSLTGLANLVKLKMDMKNTLEKNKDKRYSILKFDVVQFKVINEMFGFEIGDRILKAPKDIAKHTNEASLIIARAGVDEYFAFAKSDFLGNIEAQVNYYESYYKKYIPELGNYNISFKYGRYNIESGECDVDQIINKVTLAHNMAKSRDELAVYDYDEAYKEKLLHDAEITGKMHIALKNKEFKVFLQPKFSVNDARLIGAEALVRWIEADGTMIFPDKFIPLFEKNGFIVELDKYVLEHTCIIVKNWIDRGFGSLPVSFNCSRYNVSSPSLAEDILEIVDRYGIPHKLIEIELTESTTIENEGIIKALFGKLHKYGFKISIDDFGSGYSSLGILKTLKADTLKLDRSFFSDLDDVSIGERGDLLVDGIVKLSHNLDMYVVAEGIETAEQIELLKHMNCDAVQGYYYSRPISASDFEVKYGKLIPKI